jgi:capsule polysaccharide export protein KpsE/RkpR
VIATEKPQWREGTLIRIPLAEYWAAIVQRRYWLASVVGIGAAVSLGVSFLVPNQYSSTAQLMPPDASIFTNQSLLNSLSREITIPSVSSSGILSLQRTPGATAIAILSSRTVQDNLINQFDLRSDYHKKYYQDTRKVLTRRTQLIEDKKSGIITITVSDRDKIRARDMAQAYVTELNRLTNTLSNSSARREREFLEQRLKLLKTDLEANSIALSKFASHNAAFDPEKQGEAAVEAASKLQAELIAAQGLLSGLRTVYTNDNVQVRAAEARVENLQAAMRNLSGEGQEGKPRDAGTDSFLPSVRSLPLLGVTYYDLYRQVTLDQTIYETLTKQYELARVQEAKDIPPINELDVPQVAERKSFPHRSIFLLVGTLLFLIGGIVWIIGPRLWEITGRNPSRNV